MHATFTTSDFWVILAHSLKYNKPDELDELLASINAQLVIRRLQGPQLDDK